MTAQGRVARMLVAHADVDQARPLAEANKLDELARYLNGFIDQHRGGRRRDGGDRGDHAAHLHRAAPAAAAHSADRHGGGRRARRFGTRGLKRVALFGTRSTVESRMFGRLGVEVVMPKPDEIDFIHNSLSGCRL